MLMLDFKKLMNRTPAERAEAIRLADEAFELQTQAKIAQRTEMIEAVMVSADRLSDNARQFMTTLAYKARKHDPLLRRQGGELLGLSPAQESYLEDLHRKVAKQAAKPEQADPPQQDRAPLSRAERYGMRGA